MIEIRKKVPWFYIPMETKVREMHAKILLALFAADNGFHVVIGHKNILGQCLSFMPKGVYLHYGIVQNYAKQLRSIQSLGYKIVALDEEGLAIYNRDIYLHFRVSFETLQLVEKFFAWGDYHSNIIQSEIPELKEKILSTGNPRIDLLRPMFLPIFKEDSNILLDKYGKIILINTNFGFYNHFYGPEFSFNSLKNKAMINCPEDEIFHRERLLYQKELLNFFSKMVREVSKEFQDYSVVIRPHPSENREYWIENTKGLINVKVIHEGNVIPWLLAADVVIHNGCTTAIESYLIKTPTIAFCPILSDKFDVYLPNVLSDIVYDTEELKERIHFFLSPKNKKTTFEVIEKQSIASKHISSLDQDYACECIVNSILSIKDLIDRDESYFIISIKSFYFRISTLISSIFKIVNGNDKYIEQKFEKLELYEIMDNIKKINEVSGLFKSMKVSKLGKNLYMIRRRE